MKFRYLLICCGLLFFVTSLFGPSASSQWWENRSLQQKLTLSDKQMGELEKIAKEFQKTYLSLRNEIKEKQMEIKELLSADALEQQKVEEAVNAFAKAQQQMVRETVNMKLSLRKVLSSEQMKILRVEDPDAFAINKKWAGRQGRHGRTGGADTGEGSEN